MLAATRRLLSVTIPQAFELALQHHQAGRLGDAETIYRQILAVEPRHAPTLHYLGVVAHQLGHSDTAIELIRQAVALAPQVPDFHSNLAIILREKGWLDESIAASRQAIALRPNYPEAYNNLGSALYAMRKLEEAAVAYRQAIALRPDYPEALSNLGNALYDQRRTDEAIAAFRQAIASRPSYAEAYSNLGNALHEKGQLEDAIAAYRHAIALRPDLAEAYGNLGITLYATGRQDEAIAAYRQAILLQPNFPEAYCNLAMVLRDKAQLDEAVAACRQAIALNPDYAEAYNNLGTTLRVMGNYDEGIACYRKALELSPPAAAIHSNLLVALHYSPKTTLPALLEAHREYDLRHGAPLRATWRRHPNSPDPGRRLKIGYVSPDFRRNLIAHFLIPLLEAHDHVRFEIYCYSSVDRPDDLTDRFSKAADAWREVRFLSDEALAEQIRADRIDILVDLSQHTGGNRLPVFARKPAPVQVAWLGHPWSTGLSAIEYRLTDAYLEPEGSPWSESVEKPIRLPDSWFCFDPIDGYPDPGELPASRVGHVTFGCLNSFSKINEYVLLRWSSILRRVEGSRLMLRCPDGSPQDRVRRFFEECGIAAARVELVGWLATRGEYLQLFRRMDIALDPFPYNGGTTTCDTLWMGVPVLTLPGEMVVTRIGLSILSAAGMPEFVAHSEVDYLELATNLAGDLPRLAALRATMRTRMKTSAFMDGPRFTRAVEHACRDMWKEWCAKQPVPAAADSKTS
jgi:predicted O-linked N-acetylglucosamine transferase (SPINDLY family)